MKYYRLTNTLNIKEIGKYPQGILPVSLGGIRDLNFNQPININLLPEPSIHNKAKLTTYLDTNFINSNIFLVFKNYFIDFLTNLKVHEYQSWFIKVHHKNEVLYDYSLFRISNSSDNEFVNYTKSEFLIGKLGDWEDPSIRKAVKVESYENYKSLIDVLQSSEDGSQIRCNKLVLNLSKCNVDMFRLIKNPILTGYIVSEKLKNSIEEKHYTGMEFKELKDVDNRIEIV